MFEEGIVEENERIEWESVNYSYPNGRKIVRPTSIDPIIIHNHFVRFQIDWIVPQHSFSLACGTTSINNSKQKINSVGRRKNTRETRKNPVWWVTSQSLYCFDKFVWMMSLHSCTRNFDYSCSVLFRRRKFLLHRNKDK